MTLHWPHNSIAFQLSRIRMQNNSRCISVYCIFNDHITHTWLLFHHLRCCYSESPSNNQTTAAYKMKPAYFHYINNTKTKHLSSCSALNVCCNLQLCCFHMAACAGTHTWTLPWVVFFFVFFTNICSEKKLWILIKEALVFDDLRMTLKSQILLFRIALTVCWHNIVLL